MDIEKYKSLISKATQLELKTQEELHVIDNEIQGMLNEWARSVCPYNVGDVTKNIGYPYHNKQMRIDLIYGSGQKRMRPEHLGYASIHWKAQGTILKNDGSDSTYTATITDYDHYLDVESNKIIDLSNIKV